MDTSTLDADFLAEHGLGSLPAEAQDRILGQLIRNLEMGVGQTLAAGLTEEQHAEFESLVQAGNEEGALDWLNCNCPDHKEVVRDQFAQLRKELVDCVPYILRAEGVETDDVDPRMDRGTGD